MKGIANILLCLALGSSVASAGQGKTWMLNDDKKSEDDEKFKKSDSRQKYQDYNIKKPKEQNKEGGYNQPEKKYWK